MHHLYKQNTLNVELPWLLFIGLEAICIDKLDYTVGEFTTCNYVAGVQLLSQGYNFNIKDINVENISKSQPHILFLL